RRNQALPDRRWDLYERGCRILCEESSVTRAEAGRAPMLDANQRFAIAARIAAVTMLGHRTMVWRGPERGDTPSQAVLERELLGGSESLTSGDVEVGAKEVREVFAITSLFSSRGEGPLGWAHQTYAEFLTAWFLKHRRLSPEERL